MLQSRFKPMFLQQGSFCLLAPMLALLAVAVMTQGCEDKSLKDYQQEEIDLEMSKIQRVSGNYRGQLVSATDDQSLGTVTIQLKAERGSRVSSDGSHYDRVAIAAGNLRYSGSSNAPISISEGSYNETSEGNGTLSAFLNIANPADGTTVRLALNGTISGSVFEGAVYAEGRESFGGKFKLVKDAPEALSRGRLSQRLASLQATNGIYHGTPKDGSLPPGWRMDLSFSNQTINSESLFLNVINPVRPVQVTWFWGPVYRDGGSDWIVFSKAHIDESANPVRLSGETGPTEKVRARLECVRVASGWDCEIGRELGDPNSSHAIYKQDPAAKKD